MLNQPQQRRVTFAATPLDATDLAAVGRQAHKFDASDDRVLLSADDHYSSSNDGTTGSLPAAALLVDGPRVRQPLPISVDLLCDPSALASPVFEEASRKSVFEVNSSPCCVVDVPNPLAPKQTPPQEIGIVPVSSGTHSAAAASTSFDGGDFNHSGFTLAVPPQDAFVEAVESPPVHRLNCDMSPFLAPVASVALDSSSLRLQEESCFVEGLSGEQLIIKTRFAAFVKRLTTDYDDALLHVTMRSNNAMIDVHRLKRVIHAAKLSVSQRAKIIPPASQKKRLVPLNICVKHFLHWSAKDPQDAEFIMSALESLSDSIVNSKESILSQIEERLAKIVSDNRAKFADNTTRRVWDSVHLITIVAFYVLSLEHNVLAAEDDFSVQNAWHFGLFIAFTVFWICDILVSTQVYAIDTDGRLVKDRPSIISIRRTQLLIDALGILPIDFFLEGFGAPFYAFIVFRVIKYVKCFRVKYLFELVNRDIITPAVVVFHFQLKKVVIGVASIVLFILTSATVHSLIDIHIIEPQLGERKFPQFVKSVAAVCVVLSGSNGDFEVYTTADKLLFVALSVLSLIGIGLVVGELTTLVFSNSVSAENYQLMRDTLGIIKHYKVPRAIQQEVLSFQMHALNDDVVRHMENLALLPLQMQQEIMMYIKIDAVSRVKLFSGASRECQTVLASSLGRCIVQPEAEIVRFGDVGSIMYMIAHGYADVILGNGKVVTTFSRGDCFGEMALVQKDAKRTATVRALTYCDLWTLDKDALLEALAMYPDFLKLVEAELVVRKGNVSELRESVAAVNQLLIQQEIEDVERNGEPNRRRSSIAPPGARFNSPTPSRPPPMDAANFSELARAADVTADHGVQWPRRVSAGTVPPTTGFSRMSINPTSAVFAPLQPRPSLWKDGFSGNFSIASDPGNLMVEVLAARKSIQEVRERSRRLSRSGGVSAVKGGGRRESML